MSQIQASGKTWPRLVADLLRLIPGQTALARSPARASGHIGAQPFNQLVVVAPDPLDDPHEGPLVVYRCMIANTLRHVEIEVMGTPEAREALLHDLHFVKEEDDVEQQLKQQGVERYIFQSANSPSPLAIRLSIWPSEFGGTSFADSGLLKHFSEEAVRARFEKFKHLKPGAPCLTPETCLFTFFKTIRQPLMQPDQPKEIPTDNPAFNLRLNAAVLALIGFSLDDERGVFVPPNPIADNELLKKLCRMLNEVAFVALRLAPSTAPAVFHLTIEDATPMLLEAVSGTYQEDTSAFRSFGFQLTDHQYSQYAVLGATETFSDRLLLDRYEIQVSNDPVNRYVYFEALQNIAQLRQSEMLEIRVSELLSLGFVTFSQLQEAYTRLELDVNEADLSEDALIELYQAMVRAQPGSKGQYKQALLLICDHRGFSNARLFVTAEDMSVEDAYAFLGVSQASDDETVRVSFEYKLGEGSTNKALTETAKAALLRVAKSRLSAPLLFLYEGLCYGSEPEMSLELAREKLGVTAGMDEDSILTVFDIRMGDNPEGILELRQALRTIGQNERDNKHIASVLETGMLSTRPVVNTSTPVGLNNIGNTCYLNSLLQYYFTITPLREAVLNFQSSSDKEVLSDGLRKKVGGRTVQAWEVKRSQQFVACLAELFHELVHSKEQWISPTRDLAYLALVPPSTDDETFIESRQAKIEPVTETADEGATVNLLNPESEAEPEAKDVPIPASDEEVKPPKRPNNDGEEKKRRIDSALFGTQQDVTECIENVLFQIEAAFKASGVEEDGEQVDIVKELFYGKTKQVLESESDGAGRREKTERFSSVLVDVASGPRDIYDALDSAFGEDTVQLEGGVTRRSVTISQLPPVLQIQVQRVQFDKVNLRVFKSLAPLRFDDTIYMDRYLDTNDQDIIRRRREVAGWRREINDVKERLEKLTVRQKNGLSARDSLIATRDWFQQMRRVVQQMPSEDTVSPENEDSDKVMEDAEEASAPTPAAAIKTNRDFAIEDNTIRVLEQQIQSISTELSTLTEKLESLETAVQNQFQDMRKVGYRIHSVFIHRGQASFGHYWIYIYDRDTGSFRKYNDEYVTPVDKQVVFDQAADNSATPYFLVFVRDDLPDEFIRTVVREPVEQELVEQRPVENGSMENGPVDNASVDLRPVVPEPGPVRPASDEQAPVQPLQLVESERAQPLQPVEPVPWVESLPTEAPHDLDPVIDA